MKRQAAAADHYDKTAKEKVPLVPGQPVRLYNKVTRRWEPAVVKGEAGTPGSYIIEHLAGGVPLRRNRVHLRTTREDFHTERLYPSSSESEDEPNDLVLEQSNDSALDRRLSEGVMMSQESDEASTDEPVLPRRGDRVRKPTDRYGFSS